MLIFQQESDHFKSMLWSISLLKHYKKTLDFLGKYSSENTPFSSEITDFQEITEETSCRKFSIYSYEFSEEFTRKYIFRQNYQRKDSQESILQTATTDTRFPTKLS